MTEYEKLQAKNAEMINALDYFGLANVTHMTDADLRKFNVLLDHWQKISGDELLKRNTARMTALDTFWSTTPEIQCATCHNFFVTKRMLGFGFQLRSTDVYLSCAQRKKDKQSRFLCLCP